MAMATNKGTETPETPTQADGRGMQPQGAQAQQPSSPQQAGAPPRGTTARASRAQRALARPSIPVFGPFMLMRRLFDDIEQLWGPGEREVSEEAVTRMFMPAIDVSRRGDQLVVRVDLPGMAADDVQVMITDNALIVEGERRVESEAREEGVWRSERSYGRFQRVIPLPEGAEPDSVEARFENGVLEIALRAPEKQQRGRKVEISKPPGEQAQSSRETH